MKNPTESQEGVMLSCCKGPPLFVEEAAPGGRGGASSGLPHVRLTGKHTKLAGDLGGHFLRFPLP